MKNTSMKKLHILVAAFAALSFTAIPVFAHPDDPAHTHEKVAEKPEWFELFGDASLPVVWQSTTASADNITKALADKKLDGVAAWAETIHLASHALIDQVKLDDAEKKKRLDAALEQAAKLADEVLDAAQHNEPDKTAAEFKRLSAALTLAKTRLPKEITEAAPATPRFAKSPARDDHGHKH
jgi:hypothetical protein